MSRELIAVLLEREGYAAEAAESGESALEQIRLRRPVPDVVLADVQLPGISGAFLARKLRRACGPATLLLAMSGSQPATKAISLYDGFLMKPFTMDQVAAAIQTHEQQPKIPAAATPAKREKGAVVSGAARTPPRGSKFASIAASTAKTASQSDMGAGMQVHKSQPSEAVSPAKSPDDASVLNETIYQQLAGSVPSKQLHEMYSMCVNDARQRIAGMRKLTADQRRGAVHARGPCHQGRLRHAWRDRTASHGSQTGGQRPRCGRPGRSAER